MVLLILKLLIGILVPAVIWLVINRIMLIFSYLKIRKVNTLAKSMLYINLKRDYIFVDHVIEDYEEDLSLITISSKDNITFDSYLTSEIENVLSIDEFTLREELLNLISSIQNQYTQKELNKTCYFVSFIMHNRDQRKQNDEAHWFKIECTVSKMQYRLISQELFSQIKITENLNQPEKLNSIFPLIHKASIFCNLVIESDIEERTILCKYDNINNKYKPLLNIPFEYLISFDSQNISLSEIKEIIAKSYKDMSIEISFSRITDIGVELGEMVLFAEAITYSNLNIVDSNMHFIDKKKFIEQPSTVFSKRMYNSILRILLK